MAAPFSLANLVHELSTTTGTGNQTLTAVNGKQLFDTAFGHGATTDVFEYFISSQSQAEWEHGTGHMTDATTLVRDTVWDGSSGTGTAVNFSAGTKDVTSAIGTLTLWTPRGYIDGLILSNDGVTPNTKLDVAAGICRDSTDAMTIRLTTAAVIDTGSVGANGLDAGTLSASTWYHVYAIGKRDGSSQAALASTSATAPTLPTGYQYKRRVGSFKTDGSTHIVTFIQDGDEFQWNTDVADVSAANPGTSAVSRTLTVPLGVRVKAVLSVGGQSTNLAGAPASILISDLSISDQAPAVSGAQDSTFYTGTSESDLRQGNKVYVFTNTSQQVRSRVAASTATTTLTIVTHGWIDPRGKNA